MRPLHDRLLHTLQLIRTPSVGPITFFALVQRFGSATKALEALPELARKGGRKTPLVAADVHACEREIEAAHAFGAQMVLFGDDNYPSHLTTLADPPPILTIKGNMQLWQTRPLIAMVGARNASANGCQFAHRLAKDLSEAGVTVVSGLARGIDTFAHKGALAKATVAVIAGGIDNIYPPENAPLYQELFAQGAVISEQPFGSAPFAGSFPGRNRIIAGMSLGTVVVEASPKSGSLITARYAVDNNRDVFAVPGSPLDPRARGCNQLIKEGAILIESAADILAHLPQRQQSLQLCETTTEQYSNTPYDSDAELSRIRERVAEKLTISAVSVDELIEQCETSAAAVQAALLELELAGRARRVPGNKVCRIHEFEAA
jgi:DNA processing protein